MDRLVLASNVDTIEKMFSVMADPKLEWYPKYIVSPGEKSLIITQGNPKMIARSKFRFTPF